MLTRVLANPGIVRGLHLQAAAAQLQVKDKRKPHVKLKRKGRLPKQAYPSTAQRLYERALLSWVRTMHETTMSKLHPLIQAVGAVRIDDDDNTAAAAGDARPIKRAIAGVQAQWDATISRGAVRPGLIAQGAAENVNTANRRAMNDQFRAVIGVDPIREGTSPRVDDAMLQFTRENVSLIKTVSERYFTEIESQVSDAVLNGERPEDIEARLVERYGVAQSNAARIARDQVNKLNGQLTEVRQRDLGVRSYIWRTARDERVRGAPGGKYPKARPSHYHLEGKRFTWDNPPASGTDGEAGHPGEAIECRCYAEPNIDELLDSL